MGARAAGSTFWAVFLVLFPVAVQISSPTCVTYKRKETCGLKGSTVEFPCSYPNISQVILTSGWSKKVRPTLEHKPLKQMPGYLFRMHYLERENNDCTMKLTDLKESDASRYYFVYKFRNVTGHGVTCKGDPGVRLYILASPVRILEKLVGGQNGPVADRTVIEGQAITLTCVPTCAANLSSNPGYIWYKNGLQLNGSRATTTFLSLDPISDEDTGSYVCAMIGYKDLPSSAVNLTVQRRPVNTVSEICGGGSKNDAVSTQTDADNSKDQIFNNYQTPKAKSMFSFSIMLIASVCIGFVVAITVAVLILKVKKKRKRKRRCAGSVPGPPSLNSDFYMALDIRSMSADYDTLDTVRRCSAADHVYENLHQPGNCRR
ncbi:uncharacterized protein LOC142951689 isoform X2 [Anarhichas minor]